MALQPPAMALQPLVAGAQSQAQRMLADIVENNAQAFTQLSGLDSLRQRVREYALSREETRKRLRQTSHPAITHSPQLAAPSFNPAAFGMPAQPKRNAAPIWLPPQPQAASRIPASSYQPLQSREADASSHRQAGRVIPPTPLLHSISAAHRPVRWDRQAPPQPAETRTIRAAGAPAT